MNAALLAGTVVLLARLNADTGDNPTLITAPTLEVLQPINQAVSAEMQLADPPMLRNPGWPGIVTRVDIAVGDVVSSGSLIGAVDGIDRYVCAGFPLYRALTVGDVGDDVVAIKECLRALGATDNSELSFTIEDFAAVQRMSGTTGPSVDPRSVFAFALDEGWTVAGTSMLVGESLNDPVLAAGTGPARSVVIPTADQDRVDAMLALSANTGGVAILTLANPTDADPGTVVATLQDVEAALAAARPEIGEPGSTFATSTGTIEVDLTGASEQLFTVPIGALSIDRQCVFSYENGMANPIVVEIAGAIGSDLYVKGNLDGREVVLGPAANSLEQCESSQPVGEG